MINGLGVTPPDDVDWTPISMGDALDGLERRTHYRTVTWTKQVEQGCFLNWFQFDNTELTSFICSPPDHPEQHETYSEAYCKSVKAPQHHGKPQGIQAVFLVRTE